MAEKLDRTEALELFSKFTKGHAMSKFDVEYDEEQLMLRVHKRDKEIDRERKIQLLRESIEKLRVQESFDEAWDEIKETRKDRCF